MERLFRREGDAETYDPATGLYSEAYVRALVREAVSSCRAFTCATICAPDDKVREQVIQRLGMHLRAEDISAPLAHSQFVLVLFGVGLVGAEAIVARVFAGMSALVIGFASHPQDGISFVELIDQANRHAAEFTSQGPEAA